MKKLILLLMPLIFTSLFSDWSKIGNKEYLSFNARLVSFSVSEDEKTFIGIGFSGLIYQFDLETGRELNTEKIPNFNYENDNAIMSKDSKTYIVAKYVNGAGLTKCNLYIFDLQHNLIDSYETNFSVDTWYRSTFRMLSADYNSESKLFMANVLNSVSSIGPNVGSAGYGITIVLKNENGKWKEIARDNRYSTCLFFNKKKDLFYFNSGFSSSWYVYAQERYYVFKNEGMSNLYDFNLSQFKQFHSYSNDTYSVNKDYHFNSGFFDRKNNIVLSNGTQFYKFNQENLQNPQVFNKDIRDSSNGFYILNSKNSDEFFSFSGNRVHLYSDSFKLKSIHKISEFTQINSVYHLEKTDEILIYDGYIKLMKISEDNFFKGIADFSLPNYKNMNDETLQFTNHTYGENVEFEWDFGDSTYSNEKNPQKIYCKVGTYKVKLIAKWGTNQTEVIKTVTIVPKFKADFEYSITGSFPKYILFKNTSTGIISSYTWYFDSDSLKNKPDTIREYYIPGDYKIKLVAYANGISSTKEVTIRLDFDEIPVDTNIVKKEYLFDKYGNEALKGYYEGNDQIMFLISSDSTKQLGAIKSKILAWSKILNNKTNSLLRRDNGVFTFLDSNRIINCNLDSVETDKYYISDLSSFYYINSYKNTIQYLVSNGGKIYYLNESNIVTDSSTHYNSYYFPGTITKKVFKDYKFSSNDKVVDFYYSFYYEGTYNKIDYKNNVIIINEYDLRNFPIFTHKIERLNDSLLFTCHTDSILRINVPPVQRIDSLKNIYPSIYKNHIVFKHKDFKFSYFLFLNDSLIVFSGNKNGKPALLIINKDLELIKEYVINERVGSFNFISQATNNRLLFSGYRYKEFGIKQPYFALIEDPMFPVSSRIIDTIPKIDTIPQDTVITKIDTINIYNYPNPAYEKLKINVGLSKPSNYNLKIYNSLGILEEELQNQTYNNTSMTIELDLNKFATGMFYYILEINGINKTSKFVHLRGD